MKLLSEQRLQSSQTSSLSQPSTKLHLSGLVGTASHPDIQKIRIIGFLFENKLQ